MSIAQRSAFDLWDHVPTGMRPTRVEPSDKETYAAILEKWAQDRNRAAEIRGTVIGSFLAINPQGTKPPLIWCFNNWAEPHLFQEYLPKDQPLFAFCSFSGYTDSWPLKTRFNDPLARMILLELDALALQHPLVLAGNCQGAPIVESIALQIEERGGPLPQLITLDYAPRRRYKGPYRLFFGELSRFNPFNESGDPIALWRERGMRPTATILKGANHGKYFRKPVVAELASEVHRVLENNRRETDGPS